MYQDPLRFLHKITGYSWEHITERALKLRKVSKVPGSVVAVVSDHHESLLGSTMNPMIYYLPDGRTLHHLHRVFWSEFLEKGVMKYGVEAFPAMRFDLEDLPSFELPPAIFYPFLVKGKLSLKGDLVISHQHRMNMTTFDVTKFRITASQEVNDIISSFSLSNFSYTDKVNFTVSNKILNHDFPSLEIEFNPSSPELIVRAEPNNNHIITLDSQWKIEYNLGYQFEGKATLMPPSATVQPHSKEYVAPLTIEEQTKIGFGLGMSALMIFALAVA